MKRLICLMLCLGTLMGNPVGVSLSKNQITPYLNNVNQTFTSFYINDSGKATVSISYDGYDDVTSNVKITTQLQKRFLLVFWTDVDGGYWVDESSESSYTAVHTLSVATGTYRVQVEYLLYGTDGSVETVNDEAQYTYK